ncbi:MAG: DUF4395 family protein, partial [Pontimonas sp.]
MNTSSNPSAGIDPRSPRFGAGITAIALLVTLALGLADPTIPQGVAERSLNPAFILLTLITALFAWGAFAGVQRHPYGALFKALILPRLGP